MVSWIATKFSGGDPTDDKTDPAPRVERLNAAVVAPQTNAHEPAVGMPCCPEADATLVEREMPGLDGQLVDRASIHSVSIAPTNLQGRGSGSKQDVRTRSSDRCPPRSSIRRRGRLGAGTALVPPLETGCHIRGRSGVRFPHEFTVDANQVVGLGDDGLEGGYSRGHGCGFPCLLAKLERNVHASCINPGGPDGTPAQRTRVMRI